MFKKSNRISAMLLSGGIALGMMSGVARAENLTGTGENVPGPAYGSVKGYLAGNSVTTYDITVSWGPMVFTFDKGYWNGTSRVRSTNVADYPQETSKLPNTDDSWFGIDGTNNLVRIENRSNAEVDITASVSKVTAADPEEGSIASAMVPVTLALSGGASQSWTGTATSAGGTLTTTIDDAEEPELGNDPVVPYKTLTLSLSGTPNAGLETRLNADPSTIGTITLNFAAHNEQQNQEPGGGE